VPSHNVVDRSILKGKSIEIFREAVRSPYTLDPYERRLITFLNFMDMTPDKLVSFAKKNPQKMEMKLILFINSQKKRVVAKEITDSTVSNLLKAIRLLLEMNDANQINWKKVKRILPGSRRFALDRIPTIDEIREIIETCDVRGKALTYLLLTSGVREGAIELFRMQDYSVIRNEKDGKVLAGRLVVYRGDPEEYITFITGESVLYLTRYIEFRESNGEKITQESPLFRDKFDPVKGKYGHGKAQSLTRTVPMTPHAVRQYYNRLLYSIGVRKEKRRRHEYSVHSMRKWFKTRCELGGMKPINVETLSGRSTGVSDSYYRPTESELLEEYLKVADEHLSISTESKLRTENQMLRLNAERIDSVMSEIEEVKKRIGLT
jgi:integrase